MTNMKGELWSPMYKHKEFLGEDDHANIYSILVMDDTVNWHNKDAIIDIFDALDVSFLEKKVDIGDCVSEAASSAVKPFFLDWNPVFESMPVGQNQVSAVIPSVSNTLDPQLPYDALELRQQS